ncbi:MAG TPA: pilus assembly protein TadG-related protein [Thermoleophilaceae bacterium]|nr:pilus assembly protein TadG-related protein [Thermoleophilaceae bacterium]
MARGRTSDRSGERGAILITVVLWLPLLVLMASFVLDVANWFVHKRHLQMQADAAALAGAREWAQPACDWNRIVATAQDYGGEVFNAQIGSTPADKVHMRLNSPTYHNQSSPVDTTVGPPTCESAMVDVKLTETDLPWFLKAAQFVPFINAHARVSIIQADTIAGALPVGVPDPRPARARVTFIDEDTGLPIGERNLTRVGDPDSPIWDNSGEPLSITVDRPNIGVRVAISSTTDGPFACGDPLVECFDSQSAGGVLHIRGWSGAGTVTPADNPMLRDVRLLAGTCTGAYFSYSTAECATGIEAQIDFGTADPVGLLGARVSANLGGNQSYTLTYDPVTSRWRSSAIIPIAAGAGSVPINLHWEKRQGTSGGLTCTNGNNTPCNGDWPAAQRIFSGSDSRSGAVRNLRVFEITDPALDANSFEACATCTHDLVVELQLAPSLKAASDITDPPVILRLTGSGSLTQALDCDPAKSRLEDEIATGCTPAYTENEGTLCPEHNVLWATAQPWPCVKRDTGAPPNKIAAGLNLRILGDEKAKTCTAPNNWLNYPNISPADPRIVQVFLTQFGSFAGSGNGTEPVTGFASFYVTGWRGSGGGFANPCVGQGDDETPGDGYIMGHFVTYLASIDAGGSDPCNPGVLGVCVPVMTE